MDLRLQLTNVILALVYHWQGLSLAMVTVIPRLAGPSFGLLSLIGVALRRE